jgi:hypothetical protein
LLLQIVGVEFLKKEALPEIVLPSRLMVFRLTACLELCSSRIQNFDGGNVPC